MILILAAYRNSPFPKYAEGVLGAKVTQMKIIYFKNDIANRLD
jgi:hypothetical protein